MKAFVVYDSKVKTYENPMFFRTTGEALRVWIDEANRKDSKIAAHPEDYCLFEIGEYDESSGRFENLTAPLSLGLAQEFVKNEKTH